MNSFELFEFHDYLGKEGSKKVEYIFVSQCLQTDFKEFNTSLGSSGQDYLSYIIASALVDETIENNQAGYLKFLSMANGYTERFFQNTIHHTYNLSIINGKEELFNNLLNTAKDFLIDNNKPIKLIEFKDIQLRDYIDTIIHEIDMNPKCYLLEDYSSYNKKIQSYLLQDKLQSELNTNSSKKNSHKI